MVQSSPLIPDDELAWFFRNVGTITGIQKQTHYFSRKWAAALGKSISYCMKKWKQGIFLALPPLQMALLPPLQMALGGSFSRKEVLL